MAKPRRTRSPIWLWTLWILWALLALGVLKLWLADPPDTGLRNIGTMLAGLLSATLGLAWFSLLSGHPKRLRAIVGVTALAAATLSCVLFRVVGFSGAMMPEVVWRFGTETRFQGAEPGPGAAGKEEPGSWVTAVDDFPGFLGARRDLKVEAHFRTDWTAHPPRVLWTRSVGPAWSGVAIANGYVFTQEQWEDAQVCTAYDLATGELAWSAAHGERFENLFGGEGPRATPAVHDGRVYGLGAAGHFFCLDAANGELLWEDDLLARYDVTPSMEEANVLYGRANSPLIVGERVVIPAGGDASTRMAGLIAFECATGAVAWESPPRQVSFSSPLLATLAGVEQIVIVNEDTVSGHVPMSGEMLWESPWPGSTPRGPSVSQATVAGADRLFLSKSYGRGSMLLELKSKEGALEVEVVWRNRRSMRTKFTSPVIHDGHVYGLAEERLECVELSTGERVWREGKYGHGQLLLAGEQLVILSEDGELSLVAATPERANDVLSSLSVLAGKCWNTLGISGDKLVLRSDKELTCLELALEE